MLEQVKHLVDLNQSRSKESLKSNGIRIHKSSSNSNSTDSQPIKQVLNKWEEGIEGNDGARNTDVGKRLADWGVLTVDVLEGQGGPVEVGEVGCWGQSGDGDGRGEGLDVEGEGQGLVDGLDVLGEDVEGTEDVELDQVFW